MPTKRKPPSSASATATPLPPGAHSIQARRKRVANARLVKPQSATLAHVHVTQESVAAQELTPPHPPREDTPEYQQTHKLLVFDKDTPCKVCGVRHSTISDPNVNKAGAKALETHHFPCERSLIDALDWRKVHNDFPAVYSQASLVMWVDSPQNMLVLCLTGDTPVLMANGTHKPIAEVEVGEQVVGHDLRPHTVTATMSRHIEEDIVVLDGLRMTANHPLLTSDGWREAGSLHCGQIVREVRVLSADVIRMTGIQSEILNPIVGTVAIDVVDSLRPRHLAPNVLFHDPSMLHNLSPVGAVPNPAAPVATWCHGHGAESARPITRVLIESDDATAIGAIQAQPPTRFTRGDGELPATHAAHASSTSTELAMTACRTARAGTRTVAEGDIRGNLVCLPADGTCLDNAGALVGLLHARWRPINHIERTPFYGKVYDIEVGGCSSFVANGIIVHNCDVHHRGTETGIHHLLTQDFAVMPYLLDGYRVAATAKDEAAALNTDEQIEQAAGIEQAVDQQIAAATSVDVDRSAPVANVAPQAVKAKRKRVRKKVSAPVAASVKVALA